MILVTGSNGSVGKEMVTYLVQHGHSVLCADITPASSPNNEQTVFVQTDLSDPNQVAALFDQYSIEAVIHLAAVLYTESNAHPDKAFHSNIAATYHLLSEAAKRGIKFIYGSSIDGYGKIETSALHPADEQTLPDPNNFYALSKFAPERMGDALSKTYGFAFITGRIPVILGPGQGSKNSMWRERVFTSVFDAQPIDFTYGQYTPIIPISHVKDTVRSLYILLTSQPKHSLYNLPCEMVSMQQLSEATQSANPNAPVRFASKSNPPICPQYVDCTRFLKEFNYQLTPITQQILHQTPIS